MHNSIKLKYIEGILTMLKYSTFFEGKLKSLIENFFQDVN